MRSTNRAVSDSLTPLTVQITPDNAIQQLKADTTVGKLSLIDTWNSISLERSQNAPQYILNHSENIHSLIKGRTESKGFVDGFLKKLSADELYNLTYIIFVHHKFTISPDSGIFAQAPICADLYKIYATHPHVNHNKLDILNSILLRAQVDSTGHGTKMSPATRTTDEIYHALYIKKQQETDYVKSLEAETVHEQKREFQSAQFEASVDDGFSKLSNTIHQIQTRIQSIINQNALVVPQPASTATVAKAAPTKTDSIAGEIEIKTNEKKEPQLPSVALQTEKVVEKVQIKIEKKADAEIMKIGKYMKEIQALGGMLAVEIDRLVSDQQELKTDKEKQKIKAQIDIKLAKQSFLLQLEETLSGMTQLDEAERFKRWQKNNSQLFKYAIKDAITKGQLDIHKVISGNRFIHTPRIYDLLNRMLDGNLNKHIKTFELAQNANNSVHDKKLNK